MQRAPLPNLGNCQEKGEFSQEEISRCKACIQKNDNSLNEPGTKWYFCRNKCLNSYSAGELGCDYSDLVAKTEEQCQAPCKQVGLPAPHAECSDNFDCGSSQYCDNGYCKDTASASLNNRSIEASSVDTRDQTNIVPVFILVGALFGILLFMLYFFA